MVFHNYHLLNESSLHVVGEVYLRIKQNLMVQPGVKIEDLKEVHSHPIAIAQCRSFFRDYPNIRLVEIEDTALAARNIKEKNLTDIGGNKICKDSDYLISYITTFSSGNCLNHVLFSFKFSVINFFLSNDGSAGQTATAAAAAADMPIKAHLK